VTVAFLHRVQIFLLTYTPIAVEVGWSPPFHHSELVYRYTTTWPAWCHTCSHLPSNRAPPTFYWYQDILLGASEQLGQSHCE